MPIVSITDNENNRWKRNAKKKKKKIKDRNKEGGEGEDTEAIVKGRVLNDFVVSLT